MPGRSDKSGTLGHGLRDLRDRLTEGWRAVTGASSVDETADMTDLERQLKGERDAAMRNVLACQGDLTSMHNRIRIYVTALRRIRDLDLGEAGELAERALDEGKPGPPRKASGS